MVKVNLQLLILVWIEVTAVFTLETTTQWTILWRPFIVPGLYYERLDTPPDQPEFMRGSKCLDMCEEAFFHGPRICRYLMIEPLQADWDMPITQTIDFVDRVREMRVKNCYLFEAQKLEGEFAEKFFISKGFKNSYNKEQGTHITLEFVAEAYQSWMWPNPFDDVVVPDHFEMDTNTAQYFTNTGSCPWDPKMISTPLQIASTVTDTPTTTATTTAGADKKTVVLCSFLCGSFSYHAFDSVACPSDDIPQIVSNNTFASSYVDGCSLVPFRTSSKGTYLLSTKSDVTKAMGWCSEQKLCGFETPLYKLQKSVTEHNSAVIYGTSTSTTAQIICFVFSATEVDQ